MARAWDAPSPATVTDSVHALPSAEALAVSSGAGPIGGCEGGLGWGGGQGLTQAGDCRPALVPNPVLSGSNGERTGTAPMDHAVATVCGRRKYNGEPSSRHVGHHLLGTIPSTQVLRVTWAREGWRKSKAQTAWSESEFEPNRSSPVDILAACFGVLHLRARQWWLWRVTSSHRGRSKSCSIAPATLSWSSHTQWAHVFQV